MPKSMMRLLCLTGVFLVDIPIITGMHKRLSMVSNLSDKVDAQEREIAFIQAACIGNLGLVRKLLACDDAILNATHLSGVTALTCAAAQGHKSIVYYLLDQGANPHIRDKAQRTALMHAARAGHAKIVSRLIRASKKSINWCDTHGQSALAMAIIANKEAAVRALLNVQALREQKGLQGQSLLSLAVSHQSEKVVPLLLEADFACDDTVALGVTPLMLAAEKDAEAIARLLLQSGADVHAREVHGNTALSVASVNDSQKICKLLLKAGALVNEQNKFGNAALHHAALHDYTKMIDMLLIAGAHVNIKNNEGATPLIAALYAGNEASVKHLLQAGADVHVQAATGETALMVAMKGKLFHVLRDLLLMYDFDLERKNNSGNTILLQAIAEKKAGIALELIKFGASVHARNNVEDTPLLLAIRGPLDPVANDLLKRKDIDVNHANSMGITPLMWAAMKGDAKLCVRLLQLGADAYAIDCRGNSVVEYAILGKSSDVITELLQRVPYCFLPEAQRALDIEPGRIKAYASQRYDAVQRAVPCDDKDVVNAVMKGIAQAAALGQQANRQVNMQ